VTYGKLADRAATLPVPDNVVLKDPKSFLLIGTPAKRLDTPAKVNGTSPIRHRRAAAEDEDRHGRGEPGAGWKVVALDERKALAVKGVHQVVQLGDVVAVVADHSGPQSRV
jgi:isoquinoline 1-oxidoreductase beta subunit